MGIKGSKYGNVEKNAEISTNDAEFVGFDVISMLLGVSKRELYQNRSSVLDRVRYKLIGRGGGRKLHFTDAALLAYPNLSNLEIALLRIEINSKLFRKEKENALEQEKKRERKADV